MGLWVGLDAKEGASLRVGGSIVTAVGVIFELPVAIGKKKSALVDDKSMSP